MPTDQSDPPRHRVLVYLIAQKVSVGLRAEEELKELDAIFEREKRLEALVRELGKCPMCRGERYIWHGHDSDSTECDHCAGTGLVEAARRELT